MPFKKCHNSLRDLDHWGALGQFILYEASFFTRQVILKDLTCRHLKARFEDTGTDHERFRKALKAINRLFHRSLSATTSEL